MDIRIPGRGGEEIAAVLERPAAGAPWPAVVLVHGMSGITDHVRGLARRIAAEGFVAMVPDPRSAGIAGLAAAAAALRAMPDVRGGAVGTAGFDEGGTWAFHLACEPGAVAACVDFYGPLRRDGPPAGGPKGNLERVHELKCPFLGVFGGMDERIPLLDVLNLKETLGGRGHAIAYPRAGHAFLDDGGPTYREEEAKDAWRRAILFLRETLAPDTLPPEAGPAVPEYRPAGGKKGGRPPRRRR